MTVLLSPLRRKEPVKFQKGCRSPLRRLFLRTAVPENGKFRKNNEKGREAARKRRLYPGRAGCYAGHSEHPVRHRCPEPARVYPPVAVPQERVLRKDHVSVRGIRADVLPHRRRMGVVLQTGEGRGRAQPVVRRGGRGSRKSSAAASTASVWTRTSMPRASCRATAVSSTSCFRRIPTTKVC